MTKCFKCGGVDIATGKLSRPNDELFPEVRFEPRGLRFLALTMRHGTRLEAESYACLKCGTVWSQTDPNELRDFVRKHCKRPQEE